MSLAESEFNWGADEGQLAIDVIETPETVIIRSAIAGVKEKDLDINVNEDLVTIRGQRQTDPLPDQATLHYNECFWGNFSRSIILPCRVKTDEAEAGLKNGILTITIPKTNANVRLQVKPIPEL
jgi:HSP20 family protein